MKSSFLSLWVAAVLMGHVLAGNAMAQPKPLSLTFPELPRVYLDTTYNPPTSGNLITVDAGGDFQAALDAAGPGDIIELQAGATFTGNFTLPNKSGEDWIYVRSSAHLELPAPGNRAKPSHANLMPKIVTPNSVPAISTDTGAHHYRIIGVEIKTTADYAYNLASLGADVLSPDQIPHHIVFDRVYIHGGPTKTVRRGIALNSAYTAVIDSTISDIHEVGADSQALCGWNGPGPFKIVNNYLEGAGENIMFGGAQASLVGLTPSDIEIRGNYLFKPLSWKMGDPSYVGTPWSIKNLFELKHAQRVLIEGNILEHNWAHAQNGFAVLFTVRDEGVMEWATIQDVTFRKNIVRHTGSGVNILGQDNLPGVQTRRILIQGNLFDDVNDPKWGGADGRLFQVLSNSVDIMIDHNTGFQTGPVMVAEGTPAAATGFGYSNNLTPHGNYGFTGTGTGEGLDTLNTYFPNYLFEGNLIIGGNVAYYPPNNFFPPNVGDVGFVDYPGGDYRLGVTSPYKNAGTDGKDVGADIDAVNELTACAEGGSCGSPSQDTQPPTIPSDIIATVLSSSEIHLSWTASIDNVGVAGYRVYRCRGLGCVPTKQVGTSVDPFYQNTGLFPFTSYTYKVSAYDAAANVSRKSAAVTKRTQPLPSAKFTIGDRVQVIELLNVRSEPKASGTVLGTQPKGSLGTVIGGPWHWNQHWWWEIDYDSGVDGWSFQGKLKRPSP